MRKRLDTGVETGIINLKRFGCKLRSGSAALNRFRAFGGFVYHPGAIAASSASSLFRPRRLAVARTAGFFCHKTAVEVPMGELLWKLEEHVARLQANQLSASLNLLWPQQGLTEIGCQTVRLSDARLLAMMIAPSPTEDLGTLAERYVRGADLVAVYEESATRPVRVDAMWRAMTPVQGEPLVTALDLIVSVRTRSLDTRPDLHVQTVVPADEVLRLTGAAGFVHQRLPLPDEKPLVLQPHDGPGCLLFRLPGSALSYAEMVHPVDFQRDELSGSRQGDRMTRLQHCLFASRLEKGVLLRARVRAVFLPRRQDCGLAAECYAAFAAAEPPLGT